MTNGPLLQPPRLLRQRILDLVFPPRCVGCHRPGEWICGRCWKAIPWTVDGECIHCSRPVETGRLCSWCLREAVVSPSSLPVNPFAVARHDGIARQAVHELKYTPHSDIATVLGPLMAARLPDLVDPLVVPVPLHWSRKRNRGFNQSELLASAIGKTRRWNVETMALFRRRRTRDQVGLGPEQRRENVDGAFRWEGHRIRRPVVLVDDVYTTGSTLNACAAEVRSAGAPAIHACVFACASTARMAEAAKPSRFTLVERLSSLRARST